MLESRNTLPPEMSLSKILKPYRWVEDELPDLSSDFDTENVKKNKKLLCYSNFLGKYTFALFPGIRCEQG